MGLLQKIGLVEKVEDDFDVNIDYSSFETLNQQELLGNVSANLNEVKVETLIDDIYQENNLSDNTKSIFKIKELCDTLPKEMRDETKKTTVLGILQVSGLQVNEVVNDGFERVEVLNAVNDKVVSDSNIAIQNASEEIDSYKMKIEELQKTIALKEAEKEQSSKLISEELQDITELIKFISEGEK